MSRIKVEVWAVVPTSFTVYFDTDKARAAGVRMEDEEAVTVWAESEAARIMRTGDVDAEGWDWGDVTDFGVNSVEGAWIDWDELTPEEQERVPVGDRP